MDTDELNQLIRSLNQGAVDRREAAEPELELVRPDEPVPTLDLDASAAHTAEDEVPPDLAALLSETVRLVGRDLLLVPGTAPVVRVTAPSRRWVEARCSRPRGRSTSCRH